jgi:hypothetical protein
VRRGGESARRHFGPSQPVHDVGQRRYRFRLGLLAEIAQAEEVRPDDFCMLGAMRRHEVLSRSGQFASGALRIGMVVGTEQRLRELAADQRGRGRVGSEALFVAAQCGLEQCQALVAAALAETDTDGGVERQQSQFLDAVGGGKPDAFTAYEILDVHEVIAVVKLKATWGQDYLLLGRFDGRWLVRQILWQYEPAAASGR